VIESGLHIGNGFVLDDKSLVKDGNILVESVNLLSSGLLSLLDGGISISGDLGLFH